MVGWVGQDRGNLAGIKGGNFQLGQELIPDIRIGNVGG